MTRRNLSGAVETLRSEANSIDFIGFSDDQAVICCTVGCAYCCAKPSILGKKNAPREAGRQLEIE